MTRDPGYYGNVRREIIPLFAGPADRVLEIGCGEGATLAHLQQRGLARWTCGVERVAPAAALASRVLDEVHTLDVEAAPLPVAPASIDVLLLLDVLEHLVDPWAALRRLCPVLRPGGYVIASIPNVRHASVVLPLLLRGDWRYRPAGILDRTHLRFFTRRTAIELLAHAGLQVDATRTTGLGWKSRAVSLLTAGAATPFLELQYLLRARPAAR